MHPELRYAVEPEINDRSTASWKDIKELANRKDDGLFQAGRYGQNQPGPSNATFQHTKKCYYYNKTGHLFKECRARQRNQQSGKWIQSAHTTVSIGGEEPTLPTVKEFVEAARTQEPKSARTQPTKKEHINNMVTNMNVNGHQARVLLDTGTTGTNLMSSGELPITLSGSDTKFCSLWVGVSTSARWIVGSGG
jgi:uncharacterized Zn-binding protein involved in type VI secretion